MTETDLKQGFYVGEWEIQPLRSQVVGPAGPVHLEPRVMDVLVALASRPGEVIERSELLETVWQGRAMSDEPLNRCISKLRGVFDDSRQDPGYVETVPRRGYRLIAPVRLPEKATAEEVPTKARTLPVKAAVNVAAITALVVAGAILNWPADDRSIAILPCEPLGGTPPYIAEGVSDEIGKRLARIEELKVAARTSSAVFRNSDEDARIIARRLGVAYLVDCSVLASPGEVRVSVELINRDGVVEWSDSVSAPTNGLSPLQDGIANQVLRRIAPEIADLLQIRTAQSTQNMDAYDHVLQGRYLLARRGEDAVRNAIVQFQQAITLDETYGDAYVGLATAYAVLPFYTREAAGGHFDLAMAIIDKGIQMDPGVEQMAASIRAFMLLYGEWQWIEADQAFETALDYAPNDSDLLNWYSVFLAGVGRSAEALDAAQLARDLDRLSPVVNQRLAVAHLWAGNDELAAEYFEVANQLGMAPATQPEAYIILLVRQDDYALARTMLNLQQVMMGYDTAWVDALFRAMQEPEYRDAAVEAVLQASEGGHVTPLHLFGVWVYLDENERAIDAALALIRDRVAFNTEFLFSEEATALRRHPRFGEVIRGIRLDTYWDYHGWPAMCESRGADIVCH